MTAPASERTRQLVHIGAGSLALLLRPLAWWEAALLACVAVTCNLTLLPRLVPGLYRPWERGRRRPWSGIGLYPIAVLLLILVFSDRRDIVAAAWGILAFGDGLATLAGRRIGGATWPWNRDKTVAGTAAFAIGGGLAGASLCWWCRPAVIPPPFLWFSLGAPAIAAVVAASVETLPIRLDDNLTVPAAAGAVLWGLSLVSGDMAVDAAHAAIRALPIAVVVNIAAAGAGYASRSVSLAGAICGGVIGTAVLVTTGWSGWSLLLATFLAASITSRLGLRRKTALGIAEPRGGRRGPGNAIANTAVAAAAAALSVLTYASEAALVAFVAALAAAGSDTVASEIGKAWGRRTYLVPTFRAVAPGTSGGISLEGTAAGLAGAIALSALGLAGGLISVTAIAPIVAGATVGSLAESALGATLEGPGFLDNDVLNFLNTAIAAGVAILLSQSA